MRSKPDSAGIVESKDGIVDPLYDALFKLAGLMSIEDGFGLRLLNTQFCKTLDKILSGDSLYWKYKIQSQSNTLVAEHKIAETRLRDFANWNYFSFYNLKHIMKKDFDSGNNPYITRDPPGLMNLYSEDSYSFSKPYDRAAMPASLDTLAGLILKDNAKKLFNNSTKIASLTNQFNSDPINLDLEKLKKELNGNLKFQDYYFIGLLPYIMAVRANRCFTKFIQIYCYMFIQPGKKPELLNLNAIMKMIFSSRENYFKAEFFKIFTSFIDLKNIAVVINLIDIYYKNETIGAVQMALVNMPHYYVAEIKKNHRKYARLTPFDILFPNENLKNDLLILQDTITLRLQGIMTQTKDLFEAGNKSSSLDFRFLKVQLDETYNALSNNLQALAKL